MRKLLLVVWLLLPVAALAYHLGPGQDRMRLESASSLLAQAERHAKNQQWLEAEAQYEEALKLLPADKVHARRRVRLEQAKVRMFIKKLPVAHKDLQVLVEEMQHDENADPRVLGEAREALASSQYYMTWLMRLEGQGKDVWEPEIEAARQTYRLLAEAAQKQGDSAAAQKHQQDLEASIRLARMDLSELQGLPLPSQ